MVRLLLAIVLMIGSSALLLPIEANAGAATWFEQADPAADDDLVEPVVVHGVAAAAAVVAPCAVRGAPATATAPQVFRPPRG